YGIESSTRLITGQAREPESPDEDSIALLSAEEASEIEAPLAGVFAFPRGTGPGTCLHHILEEVDFSDLGEMPAIVRRKLHAFGLHGFDEAICEMIEKTVSVPLERNRPAFALSQIKRKARLSELQFHFPISGL